MFDMGLMDFTVNYNVLKRNSNILEASINDLYSGELGESIYRH